MHLKPEELSTDRDNPTSVVIFENLSVECCMPSDVGICFGAVTISNAQSGVVLELIS